jgi:hypothetical protein
MGVAARYIVFDLRASLSLAWRVRGALSHTIQCSNPGGPLLVVPVPRAA